MDGGGISKRHEIDGIDTTTGSGSGTSLLCEEECSLCIGGRLGASSTVFTANLSKSKPPKKPLSCFVLIGTSSGSRLVSFGLPASAMALKDSTKS
jgi:hypothetical protein